MKYLVIILLITALIFGVLLYGLISNKENKHDSKHMVLDCSSGSECAERVLNYRIKDCKRFEYFASGIPKCKKTTKGLDKISYIADPANYVPFPFTEEKFNVELLDIELQQPWDLEFTPEGSIIVTERTGKVLLFKDDLVQELFEFNPIILAETGLLGLAIDPFFEENNYIYLYLTYDYDNSDPSFVITEKHPEYNRMRRVLNKITRFKVINNSLSEELVLLDEIPGTSWHSGGRLEFGPDNKLYATTGDAEELSLSQDETFLGGKILRMNADGSIPSDNPSKNSYVYSLGHRNPQGIAWQPVTNEMYAVEHGDHKYDEVNHILPGINYGWASFKCDEALRRYKIFFNVPPKGRTKYPIYCSKQWTMAPSGMEYVKDKNSPWYNSLFLATLRGKHLHRFKIRGDQIILSEIFFVSDGKEYISEDIKSKLSNRLRDVEYYDGSLYLIGDYKGLVKITPAN